MKLKKWSKELVMTFIGTTLSIVLTFGTAHVINTKQKRADGRQTAIMVIRDMESTSAIFRDHKGVEEEFFNIAQHIDARFDAIEAVNEDTLRWFLQCMTTSVAAMYHYDDSNEKIFQSSPEAWKNIDNANFIDAVEQFYHSRKVIFDRLNNDPVFIRPISYQEWYNVLFDNELFSATAYIQFIKKYIRTPGMKRYIEYSVVRRHYLDEYAEYSADMANKCKFILGITDEEVTAYEMQKSRLGKRLKTRQLIGKWHVETNPEKIIERSYGRDQAYENRSVTYYPYSLYTGKVAYKRTTNGTWEVQGDSLIVYVNPVFEYELDRSQISCTPASQETVDKMLDEWDESLRTSLQAKQEADLQRHAFFASIDPSGDKIELRWIDEEGAENIQYMTRVKE